MGKPEFEKAFVVSPYDDFRTKESRTWREQQSRTVLKVDQFDMIRAMGESVLRTDLIRNAFQDGAAERSLVWLDISTGIWLKSRPDWLPNNLQFVPNYKSTKNGRPSDWVRDAFKYGYDQGAALWLEGLREVLGWKKPTYYFVVQEKEPPYLVTPVLLRDTDIEWGALKNRSALNKLARALDSGKWPGYAEGAVEVAMPAWSEKELLDRHEAGEFADQSEKEPA